MSFRRRRGREHTRLEIVREYTDEKRKCEKGDSERGERGKKSHAIPADILREKLGTVS